MNHAFGYWRNLAKDACAWSRLVLLANAYTRSSDSIDNATCNKKAADNFDMLSLMAWVSRKHRQSYRRADPRQQRTQVAHEYAAQYTQYCGYGLSLAIVRPCGFRNRVTLTIDLLTSGSVHAERLL